MTNLLFALRGQVLTLLARNVEANLHLFTQGGCAPTSGNNTAKLDDSDSVSDDSAAGAGAAEQGNTRVRDRRVGDRPGQVAAVRVLDWFTFSQEEGPTDSAICPQVGEWKNVGFLPR